jgi:hypothetical protein
MMIRAILLAVVILYTGIAAAAARPPSDVFELRRLDGTGTRAWERFRRPESRCGILRHGSDETKIYNTFEGAILTLDFNGVKRRVLPLLLTDKPGEDNLLKHKVRTPCVLAIKKLGSDYLIDVTTRLDPPGTTAALRVDSEGRLLNLKDSAGLFYVVGENSRGNRLIDRFDFVRGRLGRFTCLLGETEKECEYQFLNYAERVFSDEIRHQSFWPDANRRTHHQELADAIAARITDPLILKLHRLIVANESAIISPFQIWDAVLADSGMSFGPHQWDIGINPDAQRIFRALISLGNLQANVPAPERYFKSVRRFSTDDLKSFLLLNGELNAVLQSPKGEQLIVDEYVKWLESDALSGAKASLPFLDPADSVQQAMLLYYADVDNQYGDESLKASLRNVIHNLAVTSADLAAVRPALDREMMATPFAKSYPDKAAARLERTWGILNGN